MNRKTIPSVLLFLVFILPVFGQQGISGYIDTVSWNSHYSERTAVGDTGPGRLLVASDISDVSVARFHYTGSKTADVYYPPDNEIGSLKPAVILVAGNSDSHAKSWSGRALKDTDQYIQWGQVIAEHGMVAVTYELDNPQAALENLTEWIRNNAAGLGIDISRVGFFSTDEEGCKIGVETVIAGSRNYSGPKPAFAIFYYGMLPLRPSQQVYMDVPILTVNTKDYMYRGMPESMNRFNKRLQDDGAMLTALNLPDAPHYFDCREDTPESREAILLTIDFMADHSGTAGN